MGTLPYSSGSYFQVEFLGENGRYPAKEFLDELAADPNQAKKKEAATLAAAIGRVASMPQGTLVNSDRFKKVTDAEGIYEFRAYQGRLLCFFAPGRRLILTNGVIKKQNKLPRSALRMATAMRAVFFASLKE